MPVSRTWKFNRHLLPVKLILVCFTGGIHCVLPYVSVHMRSIGLSIIDITIINSLLPVFSTSGPPLMGFCADKLGRSKPVLATAFVLTALSFSGLLLVPSLRTGQSQSSINIPVDCEHNNGNDSLVITQICARTKDCPVNITGKFYTNSSCDSANLQCTNFTDYFCYNQSSLLQVNLTLLKRNASNCFYQIHSCEGIDCLWLCNRNCKPNISISLCNPTKESRSWHLTFINFFILRSTAQMFMSSCFALLDSVVLEAFRKHSGKYGRHRIWPIVAQLMFPFIAGYVMDYASSLNRTTVFWPAYLFLDILFLICMALLTRITFNQDKMSGAILKNIRLLTNRQTIPLFISAFVFGMVPGFLTVFLSIFVNKLGGPMYLIGLMSTTAGIASLVLLFYSDVLVKKIGHWNVLAAGFFIGAARLCAFSFIWNPWLVLIIESLKAFAQNLPMVALIIHGKAIAPVGLLSTMIGTIRALIYGCGRTAGVLLGGLLISQLKERRTFQIFASFQVFFGIMCLTLSYFSSRKKNNEHKAQQEVNAENIQDIYQNTSPLMS